MKTKSLFNNDNHLNDAGIYLYVDALKLGMIERLPAEVTLHVEDCARCKQEIFSLHVAVADQDYGPLGPHPYFDQKKTASFLTISTFARLAAAVLVGTGIVLFVYFNLFKEQPPAVTEEHIQPDSVLTEAPPDHPTRQPDAPPATDAESERFAANFTSSPFYENLIGQTLRSADLRVTSPASGARMTGAIAFTWETRFTGQLTLRILANDEREVFNRRVAGPGHTFKGNLEPGLYYWRLESDEELLFVDKFIIPVK